MVMDNEADRAAIALSLPEGYEAVYDGKYKVGDLYWAKSISAWAEISYGVHNKRTGYTIASFGKLPAGRKHIEEYKPTTPNEDLIW